jgi:hypothetical protein
LQNGVKRGEFHPTDGGVRAKDPESGQQVPVGRGNCRKGGVMSREEPSRQRE